VSHAVQASSTPYMRIVIADVAHTFQTRKEPSFLEGVANGPNQP
jgi:hypothetical protein